MTQHEPRRPESERFAALPRHGTRRHRAHDAANIRAELEGILRRTDLVAATVRADFTDGAASYDVASMAVIRLAALLERSEFAPWARLLSDEEQAAIRATRNIAAHAGYTGMNDDLFWVAVTVRVPDVVRRLLTYDALAPDLEPGASAASVREVGPGVTSAGAPRGRGDQPRRRRD